MGEIIDIRELMEKREAKQMTVLEFEARKMYLGWYLDAVHELRSCEMELEMLEMDYGPPVRPITGMPGGQVTDGSDRIISQMEYREQLKAKIQRCRKKALRQRDEVEKTIDTIADGNKRKVLRYVYINDMDLAEVAIAINYGERRTADFHRLGVRIVKVPSYALRKIKKELLEEHPEWAEMLMKAV